MRRNQTNESSSGIHLRVFKADLLQIDMNWNAANVQSRFWRLYANDSSGASLLLDDGEFGLEPGQVYLVPALVRFSCKNVRTIEHFYVHFDVLGMSQATLLALWDKPFHVPASDLLRQSMETIRNNKRLTQDKEAPMGLLMECHIKSAIYTAMASCLDDMPEQLREIGERRVREAEMVLPALNLIHSHFGDAISIKEMAAQCGMSADTFARRFRECVGQTPTQYLLEYRITQAAQQLLFTRDTIEQIAEATGFGNRFYFSRQFTNRIGVSPVSFRRAGQNGT